MEDDYNKNTTFAHTPEETLKRRMEIIQQVDLERRNQEEKAEDRATRTFGDAELHKFIQEEETKRKLEEWQRQLEEKKQLDHSEIDDRDLVNSTAYLRGSAILPRGVVEQLKFPNYSLGRKMSNKKHENYLLTERMEYIEEEMYSYL